jgi:anti-sigma B factor antagonist
MGADEEILTVDVISAHLDVAVVAVAGELDMGTGPALRARLTGLIEAGHVCLAVDLSGITFCDSTGVQALVDVLGAARRAGGTLRVAVLSPRVQAVFRLMWLDRVFPVYATLAEAMADLPATGGTAGEPPAAAVPAPGPPGRVRVLPQADGGRGA